MQLGPIRRAAAIATLVLVTTANQAPAQENQAPAQETPAEFPVYDYPGLTFTPGITIGSVWDSNVALAAPLGSAAADNLFLIQPFGQLELMSTRTQLVAGYRGYVRRYLDVEQLNGYDQRGFLSLRRLLTRRHTLSVRNEYADVPTTDEVELNGLPFSRAGSRSNRLAVSVNSRLSKYTDLNVRYENTWVKFDRLAQVPEVLLSDGSINGLEASVRRRLSERLSLGVEYGIRRASLEEGQRTVWFNDVGGVIGYAVGPHTRATVSGGYSFLQDASLDRDRQGPYLRAGITHTLDRVMFGASFEKSFVPSFGFGGTTASQELGGYVRMPLNRNRLYVQSSAFWRRTDPLLLEELHLDTVQARNTFGYGVARWVRLEAFHVFTRQDSRVTGGEINRQRAGLQVVVSQPMRMQ